MRTMLRNIIVALTLGTSLVFATATMAVGGAALGAAETKDMTKAKLHSKQGSFYILIDAAAAENLTKQQAKEGSGAGAGAAAGTVELMIKDVQLEGMPNNKDMVKANIKTNKGNLIVLMSKENAEKLQQVAKDKTSNQDGKKGNQVKLQGLK